LTTYKDLICHLPAKGIGTMEFDMTSQRRDAVLQAGEAAMDAFFESSAG
jgi:hypothetical protein